MEQHVMLLMQDVIQVTMIVMLPELQLVMVAKLIVPELVRLRVELRVLGVVRLMPVVPVQMERKIIHVLVLHPNASLKVRPCANIFLQILYFGANNWVPEN